MGAVLDQLSGRKFQNQRQNTGKQPRIKIDMREMWALCKHIRQNAKPVIIRTTEQEIGKRKSLDRESVLGSNHFFSGQLLIRYLTSFKVNFLSTSFLFSHPAVEEENDVCCFPFRLVKTC